MYPWSYYLDKSRELANRYANPVILKTDCDNEAYDKPSRGGIVGPLKGTKTLIEYNPEIIELAKLNYPHLDIVQGDIRDLPFSDESFDIVLDLSTLDHIPFEDLERTIREYARVTRGHLLLICWFSDNPVNPIEWNPKNQYYFDYPKTLDIIRRFFDIEEADTEFYRKDHGYLGYLLCKKHVGLSPNSLS